MTAAHDKQFFDTFTLVLGGLVVVAIFIYGLSRVIGLNAQEQVLQADPATRAAIMDRIAPVARLAVAGEDNSALAPPPPVDAGPAKEYTGEEVYNMACVACHGAGIAGAPKNGDSAAWGPRIAKGDDTLHKHAIEGFQGPAGFMPPKGGRIDLSDQSIINAVEFMVAESQ